MVAPLLQFHGCEHVAAALDPAGVLDLVHHVVHDRLIERCLLGGELAVLLDLYLVRQIVDDGWVGLEPAQHVRPGDGAQPLRRLGEAVALDRDRVPGPELLAGSQYARVEEVHDRPQLGQPVSTGVPVRATRWSARSRFAACAACDRLFLIACASSSTSRRHSKPESSSTSRVAVA
jgi:hypothetical protein